VVVEGTLTTDLGGLESGRTGFVQDETAGIAVYLDAELVPVVQAGSRVRVAGTLDSRYAQRTLRAKVVDVAVLSSVTLPAPAPVGTGVAGEAVEGLRLTLAGTVTEAPSAMSDGLGLIVDDGTGPVRVIVGAGALGALDPEKGDVVTATGPLGQRDSGGTGLTGYRLYATLPGEFVIATPAASPSPSPSPSPTVNPTPALSPAPTASPTPGPSTTPRPLSSADASPTPPATPSTAPLSIGAARLVPEGRSTVVRGIVTAEAGRLGTPRLLAIGDGSGGLPVRLADGQIAPRRGTLVELRGTIAAPYGQTEIRLVSGGLTTIGSESLPVPLVLEGHALAEATEGRLARVTGTVTAGASRATSGDMTLTLRSTDGTSLRVMADASAGLDASVLRKGATATLTGIVGQRASRKGALDGYRLWVRDRADILRTDASASPGASGGASGSPSASAAAFAISRVSIALARQREGKRVIVEGTLTVPTSLLDGSRRRTIVEDGTAAIELYLARADASMKAGMRVRVTGVVGRAWGAPRLRVEAVSMLGPLEPAVHDLRGAAGVATEWRLVRVRGTLADVHRSGDRWTGELVSDGLRIPLLGLPGGGIAAATVEEGRAATVTGIVKRPYPTATDRRYAVVPRSAHDLVLGASTSGASARPAGAGGSSAGTTAPGSLGPSSATAVSEGAGSAGASSIPGTDVPLADLATRIGASVRVGGVVTAVEPNAIRLDDGSATAKVVLEGPAIELAALLQPGDAVNATGTPEARDEVVLVVRDPLGVILLGDLGDDGDSPGGHLLATADDGAGGGPDEPSSDLDSATLVAGRNPGSLATVLAVLALAGIVAVALAAHRAMRKRRQARARLQARLEAIVAPPPATAGPRPSA
jgi:hypothetical protein